MNGGRVKICDVMRLIRRNEAVVGQCSSLESSFSST